VLLALIAGFLEHERRAHHNALPLLETTVASSRQPISVG
jgi:hypothetical protein